MSPPSVRPPAWSSSRRVDGRRRRRGRARASGGRAARRARTSLPRRRASTRANGTGNPIFGRVEDARRQQVARGLAQDALGREAGQLAVAPAACRELDEHVIEERHAALDRRRHAHLVLLHQQLDEVGLHVGVEQAVEQRPASAGRVEAAERGAVGRVGRRAAPPARPASSCALARPAAPPRSCRRTSPPACAPPRGTSGARSGAARAGQARDDAARDRRRASRRAPAARRRRRARQFQSARGYLP